LALADWLHQAGCRQVAMESTGIYWKPVFNILEGQFEITVANATHIKALPGRKTDVKDAEWIAQLLQHGLVKASFIPGQAQRQWRDITRTRTILIDEQSAAVNRLHKVLEDANIKLGTIATDIMGVSGRAILQAILDGNVDPEALADLARGRLRQKRTQLQAALQGRVSAHHRFLLATHLEHIDFLDEAIERLSNEIKERLHPFEEELDRIDTIPGVGARTVETLAAEIGLNVAQFPSAGHLSYWAGMCSGHYESAHRRKGGRTRKGSKFLRRALTEAARAAAGTNGTYLSRYYRRVAARRGAGKAAIAVGRKILEIAYYLYLLLRQDIYRDQAPVCLDERRRDRIRLRALAQLDAIGYQVTLRDKAEAT
jgi:transposase